MDTPVLYSTFFLTLLLTIGLFFFIRASVKNRTEQMTFVAQTPENAVLEQFKTYFEKRAYQITKFDAQKMQISFQGVVRPSWFLAIFLSILAAIGLGCLALVLSLLYPSLSPFVFLLSLLAPGAGVFYWKKAGRLEEVVLNVTQEQQQTLVTIVAHRDELIQLQQTFKGLEARD